MKSIIFLFLLNFFIFFLNAELLLNPEDVVGKEDEFEKLDFATPLFRISNNYLSSPLNVENVNLYVVDSSVLCRGTEYENYPDSVLLIPPSTYPYPCDFALRGRELAKAGIIAVITSALNFLENGGVVGQRGVVLDGDWRGSPDPIVVFLELHKTTSLFVDKIWKEKNNNNNNNTGMVSLVVSLGSDVNPWDVYFSKTSITVPWQVILSIFAVINIFSATVKLVFYFKMDKGALNYMPLWVLIPEIIGNILRLIYVAVDPIFFYEIFGVIASNVLLDISISISLFTAILFGFFWWSITGSVSTQRQQLFKRLTIASVIYSVVLFCLVLFVGIVRGINIIEFNLNIVTIIIALVSTLIVALLFIGGSIRVLIQLKKGSTDNSSRIRRMSVNALISAIGMLIVIIMFALGISTIFYTPAGFTWIMFIMYLGFFISSFARIQAVIIPMKSSWKYIDVTKSWFEDKNGNNNNNASDSFSSGVDNSSHQKSELNA